MNQKTRGHDKCPACRGIISSVIPDLSRGKFRTDIEVSMSNIPRRPSHGTYPFSFLLENYNDVPNQLQSVDEEINSDTDTNGESNSLPEVDPINIANEHFDEYMRNRGNIPARRVTFIVPRRSSIFSPPTLENSSEGERIIMIRALLYSL